MESTGALLWTQVAAAAACLSAMAAAVYTWLTLRLLRAQSEPKVILYSCADRERPTIVMLIIENVGRDVATDVRFTMSRPLPYRAFGVSEAEARPGEPLTHGPLVQGIPCFGPGDRREITWGQFGGLSKALGSERIRVTIRYEHRGWLWKRTITDAAELEIDSHRGTDISETPILRATKSLERIASASDKIARAIQPPEAHE